MTNQVALVVVAIFVALSCVADSDAVIFLQAVSAPATVSAKAGTVAAATATGNKAYTGVGFQPKAILFLGNNRTTSGSDNASGKFGFGMAVSSTVRASIGSADSATRHTTTKALTFINGGGTVVRAFDLVSMDADGFTLNFTTVNGTAALIPYFALGGDGLTNTAIKQLTSPTTTGNQSYTGVGFQPDAILTMTGDYGTAPPATDTASGRCGIGFATSSTKRAAVGYFSPSSTAAKRVQLTTKVIATDSAGSASLEADLVSMDADGFTLNWTTVAGTARYVWVLALKGGSYSVGSFAQPATTGNQAITAPGFTPRGTFFLSFNLAATTAHSANEGVTFGAASSSTERWTVFKGDNWSKDALYINNAQALSMRHVNTSSALLDADADFVSNDANGFTVNWTTVDATARQTIYLTVGD